ncbi:MAG: hypothetical protein AB1428_11070 [Bacteroidota bacterium]
MVKRITVLALVLAVAAGTMFAGAHPGGIARQLAMGGSGYSPATVGPNLVFNPFIYDDPAVMLLNPAYQNMYRDYAWMNIAGGAITSFNSAVDNGYGRQFAGVNFAFGKELGLGANLSFDPSFTNFMVGQLATFVNNFAGRPAQTGLRPIDVFEAVASYDLGSLDVGFGFLYGWASNTSKSSSTPTPSVSTDNELSARVLGFRLGMSMDMGGGSAFDASAAIRLDKATDNVRGTNGAGQPANSGDYSASATEIQVDGRLKLKMSNRVNFVPYVNFVTISGEPKQDAPATGVTALTNSVKVSALLIGAGAGMEYKVGSFYFAGGVSFKSGKFKTESSTGGTTPATSTSTLTGTSFPQINLGMEWTLLDWLTGRLGYYRSFLSVKSKTETSGPAAGAGTTAESDTWFGNSNVVFGSYAGPDNSLITLGLGLRFGNFALDGTVSDEALRRGFGLVGSQDNINTFGYLTASYCFE